MIQRKQTLFILGSLVCTFFLLFPRDISNSENCNILLSSLSGSPLNIFFYGSFILGFIAIFLFKNRLLQYRLCLFNMYFQICPIIFSCSYISTKNCQPQLYDLLGFFLVFLVLAFYGIAAIYIKKDEDLIKSIDRI